MDDSRWFEYDWRYEGEDAIFGVEQVYAAQDDVRKANTRLLVVTLESRHPLIKESEWRRFEALKNKLIRKFDPIYAGFVRTASTARYYFYAPSTAETSAMEVYLSKHRDASCDVLADTVWKYYFKLLYPTVAKLQTEENAKTIALYKKMGDTLASPRRMTLHVYFASESLRLLFEEQARLSGFAIGEAEFEAEYELPHGVGIYKITPLLKSDVDEITTRAIDIADRYDGKLLNWDAPPVNVTNRKF